MGKGVHGSTENQFTLYKDAKPTEAAIQSVGPQTRNKSASC